MRRLIILGNCLADRVASLLEKLFKSDAFPLPDYSCQLVHSPPVYSIRKPGQLTALANTAQTCDLVFSQPLFNYGPLNTQVLRKTLGERLRIFSAPNFEAYFPDAIEIGPCAEQQNFPPPLEWHSSIMLTCKAAKVPVMDVEGIYLNHPLFSSDSIRRKIDSSLAIYEKRETGVEIGSLDFVKANFAKIPLFHTFNHPADPLIRHLLSGILLALGINAAKLPEVLNRIEWHDNHETGTWSDWGFGFNAWPIITRAHKHFEFNGPENFRVGGKDVDITSCAIAYYHYYDSHPRIFEQALAAAKKQRQ